MHGLLPDICPLLKLHHTEVTWPFNKLRGSRLTLTLFRKGKKTRKRDVSLWLCNRKRFSRGNMHGLLPSICPLLQLHHTEVPWPFISNLAAAGYCKFCTEKTRKSEKMMFHSDCVPEKVSRSVKCMVCFPVYVNYCNCIIQKSHDHLFQISR